MASEGGDEPGVSESMSGQAVIEEIGMVESPRGVEMPKFDQMSLVKTIALSLMFVISLVANVATLVRMYRMRRRRSTINLLIVQLAVADLIVTFFCIVTDAVWTSVIQWYAGNLMCKGVKYLQVFGLYLSTYIVVVISIDRCLAILDPISKNHAPTRVRFMVVVAWVLSAVFSLPQTYIFRVVRGPFKQDFQQCVTFGAYSAKWQEQLYSCLSVLFLYVIPLVTMVTAYMLIFSTIARKSRDFVQADAVDVIADHDQQTSAATAQRPALRSRLFCKAKVKSLRMTALIVIAFIVCWTPYQVIFVIYTFIDETKIESRYVVWIFFFGMANSMINPLIYGVCHACRRKQPVTARQQEEPRPRSHSYSSSSSSRDVFRSCFDKFRRPLSGHVGRTSRPDMYSHMALVAITHRQSRRCKLIPTGRLQGMERKRNDPRRLSSPEEAEGVACFRRFCKKPRMFNSRTDNRQLNAE